MKGRLCNVSPWLDYVSQNSLSVCFWLGWVRRDILPGNGRAEVKQEHTVFTLGRLVQGHQVLLQFTHVVIYLLAHLVDVGQQSGLQPGLQLLHLPQDLLSASLVPGPGAHLTL